MFKNKFFQFSIFFLIILFINSCAKIRESAGVNRKMVDEFKVIENPPLVIPPDFNLVSPDNLEQKNIDDIEKELAEEILFGLDENVKNEKTQLSTMDKILSQSNASNVSDEIRNEIDTEFSQEKKTEGIFNLNWEDEFEVLDAVKESERIRNSNFGDESIIQGEVPIKKEKAKKKKKKRFIFF